MRHKEFNDYSPRHLERLKEILADIYCQFGKSSENFYLVGGLVPDLLVRNKLPYLKEYLGTLDIDLAVRFAMDDKGEWEDFYKNLRALGFEKQKSSNGTDIISHSFIKYESGYKPIVLDLLIDDRFPPKADRLIEIAPDVEAVKFKGVYLVFDDFLVRDIKTIEQKPIAIKVPNIIPFLTLKAFAYIDEENRLAKDAFDIWYTVVNFEQGPESVRGELLKYEQNRDVQDAFDAIRRLFGSVTSSGSKDVSDILVVRYGLGRSLANREVVSPIERL